MPHRTTNPAIGVFSGAITLSVTRFFLANSIKISKIRRWSLLYFIAIIVFSTVVSGLAFGLTLPVLALLGIYLDLIAKCVLSNFIKIDLGIPNTISLSSLITNIIYVETNFIMQWFSGVAGGSTFI
jgi:hypothetical protein